MEAVTQAGAELNRAMVARPRRRHYPIPNRLNLVLSVGQLAVSVGLLTWAAQADQLWAMLLAALLFSFVMQMGFSLLHEAEHNKLHSDLRVNDALGFFFAALFPGSYQLMKVAHLNHHRVNRSDAELVDYVKPGESRAAKTLQYYLLIHGLIWLAAPLLTLVICVTPTELLKRFFQQDTDTAIARYVAFIQRAGAHRVRVETLLTIAFWVILWWLCDLSWSAWWLCYGAFAFSWSSQQYVYHVRTPRHLIEGAYDLKRWKPMQWLYLNFNFHLSHHRSVNTPWLYMPAVALQQPTRPYLPTYLRLWLPPQRVDQAWPVEHQERGPLSARPAMP